MTVFNAIARNFNIDEIGMRMSSTTVTHRMTVTGPVEEHLQAVPKDAPFLDCRAPLRRFRDSGAGYIFYGDLLTYYVVPSSTRL